jgi:hypothetical protein
MTGWRGSRTPLGTLAQSLGQSLARTLARALASALLAGAIGSGAALAQVSDEEAARQIEESYGVEVLDVREDEIDERAVWLVTFMVPGGDSNAAFMVSRLAVDQETGELVPSFRHGASGYELPGGLRGDKSGLRPDAMRSGVWR